MSTVKVWRKEFAPAPSPAPEHAVKNRIELLSAPCAGAGVRVRRGGISRVRLTSRVKSAGPRPALRRRSPVEPTGGFEITRSERF